MATDYDAARRNDLTDLDEDAPLELLKSRRRSEDRSDPLAEDDPLVETMELPGADLSTLSEDELTVRGAHPARRVHLFGMLSGTSPQPARRSPRR